MRFDKAPRPGLARVGQFDTLQLEFAGAAPIRLEGTKAIDGDSRHACGEKEKFSELLLRVGLKDLPEPLNYLVLVGEVSTIDSIRLPVCEVNLLGTLKQEVEFVLVEDAYYPLGDDRVEALEEASDLVADRSYQVVLGYPQAVLVDVLGCDLDVGTARYEVHLDALLVDDREAQVERLKIKL